MAQWIEELSIYNFRGIKNLHLKNIGDVNLITGKNNIGKSSVLEAICILASGKTFIGLGKILEEREETNPKSINLQELLRLFYNFPSIENCTKGFSIEAHGKKAFNQVRSNVSISFPKGKKASLELEAPYLKLTTQNKDTKIEHKIRLSEENNLTSSDLFPTKQSKTLIKNEYLSSFTSHFDKETKRRWDKIALTDLEKEVISGLQIISPDITALTLTSDGKGEVIVKSKNFKVPVPLKNFGDGTNKLFSLILAACNAKDGILLVDEIENGVHYAVQNKIWELLFTLSKKLNIQIFATTHSKDCIEAFGEVQNKTFNKVEGKLFRLKKTGKEIVSIAYDQDDLKVLANDNIEVR